VHLDHDVGVDQARCRLEPRPGIDQRSHHGAVAEQQEFDLGMAGE
jgi:hypothetical protein